VDRLAQPAQEARQRAAVVQLQLAGSAIAQNPYRGRRRDAQKMRGPASVASGAVRTQSVASGADLHRRPRSPALWNASRVADADAISVARRSEQREGDVRSITAGEKQRDVIDDATGDDGDARVRLVHGVVRSRRLRRRRSRRAQRDEDRAPAEGSSAVRATRSRRGRRGSSPAAPPSRGQDRGGQREAQSPRDDRARRQLEVVAGDQARREAAGEKAAERQRRGERPARLAEGNVRARVHGLTTAVEARASRQAAAS